MFKVGDKVKVVEADDIYATEFLNETGEVCYVCAGNKWPVDVKFGPVSLSFHKHELKIIK